MGYTLSLPEEEEHAPSLGTALLLSCSQDSAQPYEPYLRPALDRIEAVQAELGG